jgi:hypothetical protein
MTDRFSPSKIKLRRARQHIEELRTVLDVHLKASPPTSIFTPATESMNAQLAVSWKGPPESVGAIVGDIIHNLRAALDLMAVKLVELAGKNTKGVYFPFCESENDLGIMIRKRNFDRAGPEAVRLLKSYEPFKGGKTSLRALHDLDIQDKHHSLIPNAAIITSPALEMDMSTGSLILKPVEDSVAAIEITFPDDSPLAGREMVQALQELVELVEGVLEAFATLTG